MKNTKKTNYEIRYSIDHDTLVAVAEIWDLDNLIMGENYPYDRVEMESILELKMWCEEHYPTNKVKLLNNPSTKKKTVEEQEKEWLAFQDWDGR